MLIRKNTNIKKWGATYGEISESAYISRYYGNTRSSNIFTKTKISRNRFDLFIRNTGNVLSKKIS